MVYALIVIFTYGMPMPETNLLGESVQRPMQPTMMAFTVVTTPEKCEAVLAQRIELIRNTFTAKGATTFQLQQKACQGARETEQYLEVMHAMPVDSAKDTHSYILPM